jgi:hypothetical protein
MWRDAAEPPADGRYVDLTYRLPMRPIGMRNCWDEMEKHRRVVGLADGVFVGISTASKKIILSKQWYRC